MDFMYHSKQISYPVLGTRIAIYLLLIVAALAFAFSTEPRLAPTAPALAPYHDLAINTKLDYSMPKQIWDIEGSKKDALTRHLAERYKQNIDLVRGFVNLAWSEAKKHPDVSAELILAVVQKESSLRPYVQSSYGAQGLMQVVPRWHPEKIDDTESLLDPKVNIRVGAEILQEYLDRSDGELSKALKKYSGNAKGYSDFVIREAKALTLISAAVEVHKS